MRPVEKRDRPDYQRILRREFEGRIARNSRYSLRAFARSLGVSPAALSQIFNSKRIPSARHVDRILQSLGLPPDLQARFARSVAETQRDRGLLRLSPAFRDSGTYEISHSDFESMASLLHYAVLELTEVEGFRPEPVWIARRLRVSHAQASLALERLFDRGLLVQRAGRIRKVSPRLTTASKNKTTPSLRSHQREVLTAAIGALDAEPIERRASHSLTFSANPERVAEIRDLLEKCLQQICKRMQRGRRTQIYQVILNLFPLTQPEKEKSS